MKIAISLKDPNAVWCAPLGNLRFIEAMEAVGCPMVPVSSADIAIVDSRLNISDTVPTLLFCWRDAAEIPLMIEGTETGRYDDRENLLGYITPSKAGRRYASQTSVIWGKLVTDKPHYYLTTMPWERLWGLSWEHPTRLKDIDVSFCGLIPNAHSIVRTHREAMVSHWKDLGHLKSVGLFHSLHPEQPPLSRADAFEIVARSKVVVSPHGVCELCWRDYEAVLGMAMIVKPTCDIEASCNPFGDNVVDCNCYFRDLAEAVEVALSRYDEQREQLEQKTRKPD